MILFINELILFTEILSISAGFFIAIHIVAYHDAPLIQKDCLAPLAAIVKGKMNGFAALDNPHQRC